MRSGEYQENYEQCTCMAEWQCWPTQQIIQATGKLCLNQQSHYRQSYSKIKCQKVLKLPSLLTVGDAKQDLERRLHFNQILRLMPVTY